MGCQERKSLAQVYYAAQEDLSRLTAEYDVRTQGETGEGQLKVLLAARVAYDKAAEALEIHERQHGCAEHGIN